MAEERRYRSVDVLRAAGITYRQLDYWSRRGLLGDEALDVGSGHSRSFTFADVVAARLCMELVRVGVAHEAIVEAIALVLAYPKARYLSLWMNGSRVSDEPEIRSTTTIVIDLDPIRSSSGLDDEGAVA